MKFDTKMIVPILTSLFIIYFLYRAYTYLGDLKRCNCAPKLYASRLENLELIYIALYAIGIITAIFSTNLMKLVRMSGTLLTSIFVIALLVIYLLFIYNAYQFQDNLNETCGCALKWSRVVVYIQAIMYSIPLITILLGLIFGLSNIGLLILIIIAVVTDILYLQEKKVPTSITSTTSPLIINKNELSKTSDILLNAPMPITR